MKQFFLPLAFALTLFAHAAGARAEDNCASTVTNAPEAASKAYLVVEAEITLFFHSNDKSRPIDIVIEKARTLFAAEPTKLHATTSIRVDACVYSKNRALNINNEKNLEGKRMRFYLAQTADMRGFQLLFMQPVGEALPPFPDLKKGLVTKAHAHPAGKILPDGWRQAYSTDGKFSIDMPGSYEDITRADRAQPGFMLRGTGEDGVTLVAVFEPAGRGASLSRAFDDSYNKPHAAVSTFKGSSAVTTRSVLAGPGGKVVSHGLWIKTKTGTFMLAVAAPEDREPAILKIKDRFFNSLRFE